MQPVAQKPKYLFVGGCPRSGTTAMVKLLNAHPRLIMGRERFRFQERIPTAEQLLSDSFFAPPEHEARFRDASFYSALKQRWDTGSVRYIGDKLPAYLNRYEELCKEFPGCRLIVLLRDLSPVAASYNARKARQGDVWHADHREALVQWNRALKQTLRALELTPKRVYPVLYSELFSGDREQLSALFQFLGMRVSRPVSRTFSSMTRGWTERVQKDLGLTKEELAYLDSHAEHGLKLEVWRRASEIHAQHLKLVGAWDSQTD